jgi:hypothetical protein
MENQLNENLESPNLQLDYLSQNHLDAIRKWTLFLSILGFVFIGLMFAIVIVLSVVKGFGSNQVLGFLMFIPLIFVCAIYFFPIYFLFQFARYSKMAILNKNNELLSQALLNLKRHYTFMGILAIIGICVYIVVIPIMISTGAFMR